MFAIVLYCVRPELRRTKCCFGGRVSPPTNQHPTERQLLSPLKVQVEEFLEVDYTRACVFSTSMYGLECILYYWV